jgi:K+-transporting ATPase KdpF subunit
MTGDDIVGLVVAAGVAIYLIIALIKPEKF